MSQMSQSPAYIGRLAPSPTGALHLGNVRTFMIAWLRARSQGGKVIFRMEDLDHPKDKPGAAAQAVEDLRWLGFDWDEEYVQSERKDIYRAALEALREGPKTEDGRRETEGLETEDGRRGCLVYPCVCSRRDVEAAQSAPHAGEQLHYPGTCRGRFASWAEAQAFLDEASCSSRSSNSSDSRIARVSSATRTPCWRFAVAPNTVVAFDDAFAGHYEQNVSETLGDFPLARDEFGAGYTLACTVDDLLMGVTEVVRGDDLLPATPAQILLANALAPFLHSRISPLPHFPTSPLPHFPTSPFPHFPTSPFPHFPISYCHVPLVVGRDGKRLAKRHGDTRVAAYRAEGKRPEEILGFLAASCGWAAKGERVSLRDLVPRFDLGTIPHEPFMI